MNRRNLISVLSVFCAILFFGFCSQSNARAQTSWVIGGNSNEGRIYYTSNGANWTSCLIDPTHAFAGICFLNADTGWVVGTNGVVYHTEDGGVSWSSQNSKVTARLNSVDFANGSHGIAVGDSGVIIRTVDGGATWDSVHVDGITDQQLEEIYFTNDGIGWIGGYGGTVLRSSDLGVTWSQPVPFTGSQVIEDFCFVDAMTGWAAGWFTSAGHIVLRTTDGGNSWSNQDPPTNDLHGVTFLDALSGFVCGWGGIFRTTDGGGSWAQCASGAFFGIRFVDSQTGWACGDNGKVYITTDGGATWTAQRTGPEFLRRIDAVSDCGFSGCAPQLVACHFSAADVNCDGVVSIQDVVLNVNEAFRGAPPYPPCCTWK